MNEENWKKFKNEFITWVEGIGGSYLGITKEVEK